MTYMFMYVNFSKNAKDSSNYLEIVATQPSDDSHSSTEKKMAELFTTSTLLLV
jgi:hypothetical protein